MRFQPKTEDEVSSFKLLPPGTYSFQVVEAIEKKSKAGNDMIELKLLVWDIEGKEHIVFDYLLESVAYKLRHFAEVTGLIDKYQLGAIEATDCLSKSGKVEIEVKEGNFKPDGGKYSDKNSVKDYVRANGAVMPSKKDDSFIDDDLPF